MTSIKNWNKPQIKTINPPITPIAFQLHPTNSLDFSLYFSMLSNRFRTLSKLSASPFVWSAKSDFMSLTNPSVNLPPHNSKSSRATGVYFEIIESNLSAQDIVNSEYRGNKIPIDKDTILFSIRYDAEITFKKDCLDFCEAVSQPGNLCEWIALSSAESIMSCLSEAQTEALQDELCDVQPCGDITYNVFVNGALRSTSVLSGCVDQTLNIYP